MTRLVYPLLAALVILVACDRQPAAEAPPAASTPPSMSSPSVPLDVVDAGLPNGEVFVLVRDVRAGRMTVDPAEFLSGDEALALARSDGFIPPTEDLPNDFYLRNVEEEVVDLYIAPDATFTLIGFDAGGGLTDVDVNAAELETLFSVAGSEGFYGIVPGDLPMHLVVSDGGVTRGVQQYVP